jgi:hypothetical protein
VPTNDRNDRRAKDTKAQTKKPTFTTPYIPLASSEFFVPTYPMLAKICGA